MSDFDITFRVNKFTKEDLDQAAKEAEDKIMGKKVRDTHKPIFGRFNRFYGNREEGLNSIIGSYKLPKVEFKVGEKETIGRFPCKEGHAFIIPKRKFLPERKHDAILALIEKGATMTLNEKAQELEKKASLLLQEAATLKKDTEQSLNKKPWGLNEIVKCVHEMANKKGWHDKPREEGTMHMLMVSEIAEATEEARNDMPPVYAVRELLNRDETIEGAKEVFKSGLKPEGEAVELADCVIRIMDYFGHKGWDLDEILRLKVHYNATRPHRHGGKAF